MDDVKSTAPVFVPPHTVLGGETLMSLVFAHMFMDARQATLDNQANARAWQTLQLRQAQNRESLDLRSHKNGETIDHLADTAALTSDQTGQTENEQTVDPIVRGTGDDIADDKAGTLASDDVAKLAAAVAAAGQAVNADATNANNVTAQAAILLMQSIAKSANLTVTITPAAA